MLPAFHSHVRHGAFLLCLFDACAAALDRVDTDRGHWYPVAYLRLAYLSHRDPHAAG